MLIATLLTLLLTAVHTLALPRHTRAVDCCASAKIAAIEQEIKTIGSHSAADAALIPLAANASRSFYVTPNDLNGAATAFVNVGMDATSVRLDLVTLATLLNAKVPGGANYTVNDNGTVTSDFIQTDYTALPYCWVREIHEFDGDCNITTITGYVHGPLAAVTLPA